MTGSRERSLCHGEPESGGIYMAVQWTTSDPFVGLRAHGLKVRTRRRGGATVVAVRGEIDISTVPELAGRLDALRPADLRELIVDLGGVDHLAADGLRTLVRLRQRVRDHGGSLRLVCGGPKVRRVFQVTDLDKVFPLYDSLSAAFKGRTAHD